VLFFMTIPGLAVTLVALAALDRLGLWLRGRSGLPWYRDGHRPAPAPGLDELEAVFYSSKRHTIDQRRAEHVLRDDEYDGAPPDSGVDLTGRRVAITLVPRLPATEARRGNGHASVATSPVASPPRSQRH
jgi:Family of unknown function (DUF6191)